MEDVNTKYGFTSKVYGIMWTIPVEKVYLIGVICHLLFVTVLSHSLDIIY